MSITNDPMAVFLYAVKSQESKRQYPRRFKMFLDFLGFGGALDDQAREFGECKSKSEVGSGQSDSIYILSKRKGQVWKDISLHNTKLLQGHKTIL